MPKKVYERKLLRLQAEQENRFRSRLGDPMRRWKLFPMDLESISRWEDYSRAASVLWL
jgi:polyphosphate kinase 2 (PPK2 family)